MTKDRPDRKELTAAKFRFHDAVNLDNRLTDTDRRISWLLLSTYLNYERQAAWPSAETIAKDLQVHIRTVRRSVDRLTRQGGWWIKQQTDKRGGRGWHNRYTPNWAKADKALSENANLENSGVNATVHTDDDQETVARVSPKGGAGVTKQWQPCQPNPSNRHLMNPGRERTHGDTCSKSNHDREGSPKPLHKILNLEGRNKTNSTEPTKRDDPPALGNSDEWDEAVEWVTKNGDYREYGSGYEGLAVDDMGRWRQEKGETAVLSAVRRARENNLFGPNLTDFLKKTRPQKRRRSGD